jgi:uncharacterized membrane protein
MSSPPNGPLHRRRGLAALALAIVLAVLATAASPPARSAVPRATASIGVPPLDMMSAFADGAAARGRKGPATTSGNFLLGRGVFAPLEDLRGAAGTAYTGANNRGEFVGTYTDAAGTLHGFRRDRKGRFTTIDPPGSLATFANGINDHGEVVGYYGVAEGKAQSFLRDRSGDITTIEVPGAVTTAPFDINNRGQVVGLYADTEPDASGSVPPNSIHGFVWTWASVRKIDVPGAIGTAAFDINDRGEVVGIYADPKERDPKGTTHGFRLRKGAVTRIDPPGAVDIDGSPGFRATAPLGINNRGQVVGQYADAQGLHAYLLDDGVYRTIDPPAGPGTTATDINDRGQIVIPKARGLFIGR